MGVVVSERCAVGEVSSRRVVAVGHAWIVVALCSPVMTTSCRSGVVVTEVVAAGVGLVGFASVDATVVNFEDVAVVEVAVGRLCLVVASAAAVSDADENVPVVEATAEVGGTVDVTDDGVTTEMEVGVAASEVVAAIEVVAVVEVFNVVFGATSVVDVVVPRRSAVSASVVRSVAFSGVVVVASAAEVVAGETANVADDGAASEVEVGIVVSSDVVATGADVAEVATGSSVAVGVAGCPGEVVSSTVVSTGEAVEVTDVAGLVVVVGLTVVVGGSASSG